MFTFDSPDLRDTDDEIAQVIYRALQNPQHPMTQSMIHALLHKHPVVGQFVKQCDCGSMTPVATVGIIPVTDPKTIAQIERTRRYADN